MHPTMLDEAWRAIDQPGEAPFQLLPDDLYQHTLPSAAVELPVVDLLPRPQVQPPIGDGHNHWTPSRWFLTD